MGLNISWTKRRAALSIAECRITLSSALVPYIIHNKNLHFVCHFLGAYGPIPGKSWKKSATSPHDGRGGINLCAFEIRPN